MFSEIIEEDEFREKNSGVTSRDRYLLDYAKQSLSKKRSLNIISNDKRAGKNAKQRADKPNKNDSEIKEDTIKNENNASKNAKQDEIKTEDGNINENETTKLLGNLNLASKTNECSKNKILVVEESIDILRDKLEKQKERNTTLSKKKMRS